jgi:hypothetical protein
MPAPAKSLFRPDALQPKLRKFSVPLADRRPIKNTINKWLRRSR